MKLFRSPSLRIAALALAAALSLVPLPLRALPYGSLDWVEYDPAYRQGCSWPAPPVASGASISCAELAGPPPAAPAPQRPTAASPTPSPEPPALKIPCAEVPEPGEPLAAVVNGQEMGRAAFEREVGQFLQALETAGVDVSGPEIQARLPELRRRVLELLIEDILVQQAAVEAGIGVSEESIEAQVAADVQMGGGLELFQAWLEQTGQGWEEYRRDTCQGLLHWQLAATVTGPITGSVEAVGARLIVVPSYEEAVRALARLASGEAFALVAQEVSVDAASREQGGDLGRLYRGQGLAEAPVEDLAFAGQPGEVQGPVAVSGGYALVQTLTPVSREVLDTEGQAAIQALAFRHWLEERRQTADVQVFVDAGE